MVGAVHFGQFAFGLEQFAFGLGQFALCAQGNARAAHLGQFALRAQGNARAAHFAQYAFCLGVNVKVVLSGFVIEVKGLVLPVLFGKFAV